MDFLQLNTKSLLDSELQDNGYINANGKDVIVIGGGDTGNDCIGTSMRHGAKSVVNFELLPKPPVNRGRDNPWPQWPRQVTFIILYSPSFMSLPLGSSAPITDTPKSLHISEAVCLLVSKSRLSVSDNSKILDPREYCISTKDFVLDDEGKLKGLNTVRVEWTKDSGGRWKMEEVPGSEKFFPAQLVFLALGFLGPQNEVLKALGIKQDARSNVQTPPKVRYLVS